MSCIYYTQSINEYQLQNTSMSEIYETEISELMKRGAVVSVLCDTILQ